MNIALCYENVDPTRGGCETYIADLLRRFARDDHEVHLYACRWRAESMPTHVMTHSVPLPRGPRFLRPWRFGRACLDALAGRRHDVTIGFDKTWGLDVHYPQGGVYAESQRANLRKHASPFRRRLARLAKALDPAVQSYLRLERMQFLRRPTLIVNSELVLRHAVEHYGINANEVHVVHAAIDPMRFEASDRASLRAAIRQSWGVSESESVALFVAMNYRLKGLEPLLHAMRLIPPTCRLVVVGNPRFGPFQRLARRLNVAERVIFHGFCDDARAAYFGADFLVHPTFYDPCSLVALEALACGLPVVTSRFNGASELIDAPRAGRVIDAPHDPAELAEAMTHFLDSDQRRSASHAALAAAERWTFDDHYRKMMAILETVAARKRAVNRAA